MKRNTQQGLIGIILLIIIMIAILSYFSIDLKSIFESESFQNNMRFTWALTTTIWVNYLQEPAIWVYQHILQPYVVEPIKDLGAEKLEEGLQN
jgi:hypothetical protein